MLGIKVRVKISAPLEPVPLENGDHFHQTRFGILNLRPVGIVFERSKVCGYSVTVLTNAAGNDERRNRIPARATVHRLKLADMLAEVTRNNFGNGTLEGRECFAIHLHRTYPARLSPTGGDLTRQAKGDEGNALTRNPLRIRNQRTAPNPPPRRIMSSLLRDGLPGKNGQNNEYRSEEQPRDHKSTDPVVPSA